MAVHILSQQQKPVLPLPELLFPVQRRPAAEYIQHHRLDRQTRGEPHGGGRDAVYHTHHIKGAAVGGSDRQGCMGEETGIGERISGHGGSSFGTGIDSLGILL
ncbi:hypothetical protein SDC9_183892 [bioreactor metagenome]|uniref:Uncharacterized protein n=1 Tax=bioreactor metagenome TaxID=1076179 RepID=A0A645HL94_9ZZZZ